MFAWMAQVVVRFAGPVILPAVFAVAGRTGNGRAVRFPGHWFLVASAGDMRPVTLAACG
jgi:hypothetical protein